MFKILSLAEQEFSTNPLVGQYVTVRTGSGEGEDAFAHILLGDFRTFMTTTVNERIDDLAEEIAGHVGPSIWPTARTLSLTGLVSGSASFDGSQNFTLLTTIADGALSIAKVDGLQTALDGKLAITGNAATATRLQTARNIALTGIITGTASFNGSANASIATTIADGALTIAKVSGLQGALDAKAALSGADFTGSVTVRGPALEAWAFDAASNAGLTLRNTAGLEQGSFIWDRTTDSVRMRRASGDGASIEGELALYGDRVTFNGATLYHTGNLNASALSYLSAAVTEYGTGAGADCNTFLSGTKNLVHNSNANTPGAGSTYWYIETVLTGTTANTLIQRAYSPTVDEQYVRRSSAGAWGAWRRQWNSSNFDPTGKLDSNAVAASAAKLQTARTIALTGGVTGTGTFDGSANLSIATTIADGSLSQAKVNGLTDALADKVSIGQFGVGGAIANYNWAAEVRQSQFAVGTTGSPESGKNYMGMHVVLNHADYYAMDLVARNNKLWFQTTELGVLGTWNEVYHTGNFNPALYTQTTRSVLAGNGITGGGTLAGDITLTLGTPTTLSGSTTNAVTAGSHTHALSANLKAWDAVTVASKLDATATAAAATKLATARTVSLTGPITAAGVLFDGTANLTLATAVADGALSIAKVSGLQALLDSYAPKNNPTFTGTARLNGDLLPDADNVRSLGAPNLMWKDVYIGPGSLYINGQKVLEDNSGTIRMLADPNQNIAIQTSGSGDIELAPTGTGVIQMKGTVSFLGGSKIRSSNGSALLFDEDIQFSVGTGLIGTPTVNGNVIYHAGNLDLSTKLDVGGNAATATRLLTSRNIALSGTVTGTASFNGSANATIATTIADNALTIAKVSGLQTALNNIGTTLDGKTSAYFVNIDQFTAGTNLAPNGSFEDRSPINTDRPKYYTLGGTASGRTNSFVPSSVGPAGNAFRIDATTVAANQFFDVYLHTNDGDVRPTATPQRRYQASTDFRGTPGGTFQLYIQFFDAADAIIATATSIEYVASETWQRAKVAGTAPATAVKVRAYAGRMTNKGSTTIAMWMEVDNHMLAEGDVATSYTPHAKDTYTDAEVLAKLLTVDGAGSGLDADTLDGVDATSFLRLDVGNSGNVRINSGDGRGIRFWDSDSYKIYMSAADTIGWGGRMAGETTSNHNMYFRMAAGTNRGFVFGSDTTPFFGINPNGVRSAVEVTAPVFNGNLVGQQVRMLNPNNLLATAALEWSSNQVRLRIGGTGSFTDAPFVIQGTSDVTRMSVDSGGNAVFRGSVTATNLIGNASTASQAAKLTTARTIALTGMITGSVDFDGTANVSMATTVADDSLTIAKTAGLQAALDGKLNSGAFGLGTVTGGFDWATTVRASRFAAGMTNGPVTGSVMGVRSVLDHANHYAASFVARNNQMWFQTIENGTVQAWNEVYHSGNFNPADYIASARTVTAGNGLTGGGALSANITVAMGTPGSLSGSTTNAVTSTSHTHALSANLKLWDATTPTTLVAASATKLAANRTLTFLGDLSGNYNFDGSSDVSINARVRSVPHGGTGASYSGQWTRICRATVGALYEDAVIKFALLGYSDGSNGTRQGTVLFRVKQQVALPGLPYVNVEMESTNYLSPDAFVAVIGDTTSYPVTVDLYMKMSSTHSGLKSTVLARGGSRTLEMIEADGYVATLPAGTQVVGVPANLRSYTKALEVADSITIAGNDVWHPGNFNPDGRVERGTSVLNQDSTVPTGYFTDVANQLALKMSQNTTGSTGYPTEFGATLSVIMARQPARSFDLHMATNSTNYMYYRGYPSTGTSGGEWKTVAALQNPNSWSGLQTFTNGVTFANDKVVSLGTGGGTLRATSTGSVVVSSGTGGSGFIYFRPNGDTVTTGQVVVFATGVMELSSIKSNASGAGSVFMEMAGDRAWQFRQIGTGATSGLELFDTTGGKAFHVTSTSNSNRISMDPSLSRVSANEFVGTLTGNAATASNASAVGGLAATSFVRGDAANSTELRLASQDGRGLRFWDNDSYKIWMSSTTNATWGGRNAGETASDYNMYFRMGGGTNRGFVFEGSYASKMFSINPDGVRSVPSITAPSFLGPLRGNADTATKLLTARTINGVAFDGSANITIAVAMPSSIDVAGSINAGAGLRSGGWGGVTTNGVVYFGTADSYIFKSGNNFAFKNEQGGYTATLTTGGNIWTTGNLTPLDRNAGGNISGSINTYNGAVNTQSGYFGVGWNNNINRWLHVMEGDGSYALYSYNTSGGGATSVFNVANVAGGADAFGAFKVTGGIKSLGASACLAVADRNLTGPEWNLYASASAFRIWAAGSGDRFSVTSAGNANIAGRLDVGSQIYLATGWFRSQQAGTGWYSDAHGGGIHMQDSQWVRTYNQKGFLIASPGGNDGGLRLESSAPTVIFYDTDTGRTNWLHCNDDNIGFLANNSFSWCSYRDGSNNWITVGNIVGYASDERLKHHIVDVNRAIPTDFFDRFEVREFDWNYDAIAELNPDFKPIADHEVGGIAQEVEKVYPYMVTTHESTGIKTIMWDKAVPLLISEVQELRKLKPVVDELLERLAALEAKVGGA